MKKSMMTLAAVFCCAVFMTMSMTSCTNDIGDNPIINPDPQPGPEQLADVTVLFYGHGGGNLDDAIIGNLRQFYRAEPSSYNNVKVAVEYKFSSTKDIFSLEEGEEDLVFVDDEYEDAPSTSDIDYIKLMNPEGYSTFRFVLDPDKTLRQQAAESYLPGENCDFTSTDSLTNFINWAAKACPAKTYLLILSDHGGGYTPDDEVNNAASTRGIIYDHGHDSRHFTAKSLASAIQAAAIRPDVIYYDACLMNMLEYQFELKDVTDYVVASTYTVPGPGGIYDTLLDCLSNASGDIDYALEKYIEYAAQNWEYYDESLPLYNDITVTSTARLDKLGQTMREFVDRLCDTYQNGTDEQRQKIDNVTKNAVKVDNSRAFYDAAKYMASMMIALPEVYDYAFFEQLSTTFNDCIVAQCTSKYLLNHNYQVDYGVMLATKGVYQLAWWEATDKVNETNTAYIYRLSHLRYCNPDGTYTTYTVIGDYEGMGDEPDYTLEYKSDGTWGGTLESVYGQTAFDRAVGWSRWLLLNEQEPPLWSRHDFLISLPDGDLMNDPSMSRNTNVRGGQ